MRRAMTLTLVAGFILGFAVQGCKLPSEDKLDRMTEESIKLRASIDGLTRTLRERLPDKETIDKLVDRVPTDESIRTLSAKLEDAGRKVSALSEAFGYLSGGARTNGGR